MSTTASQRQSALCWQGWRLAVSDRWNPVKLEGDPARGMILLADLHRPRLGIRWQTIKPKADVADAIARAMLDEVGELAAKEAVDFLPPTGEWTGGRLYLDPAPPGRDVWIGYSPVTRRLFQVVHHAKHRDQTLAESVLPTFADDAAGEWSIFDLSCKLPANAVLEKQRLNVGDLSLEFSAGKHVFTVRQIAVASVALQRQPIERWLMQQQAMRKQFYRPAETIRTAEFAGRPAITRTMVRRRRHFLLRSKPKHVAGVAMRDERRDRLIIVESSDASLLQELIESVGWSNRPEAD